MVCRRRVVPFPWLLTATQMVLLWWPVRGVVQAIGNYWYVQGVVSLWLAPFALAAAYYIVPKVTGRAVPSYEAAPLSFWVLIFVGTWTGGRFLIGGPVPAWIPTLAVVGSSLLLFHYVVVGLNLRIAIETGGTAMNYIRFGLVAYVCHGLLEVLTSFRGLALQVQFTLAAAALQQVILYGAISMIFFGAIQYMVPRLTGRGWSLPSFSRGHLVLVMVGIVGSVLALVMAGQTQGALLQDPKVSFAEIFSQVRFALLLNTSAQLVLLAANLLLLVNFARTVCVCGEEASASPPGLFRQPGTMEAPAS